MIHPGALETAARELVDAWHARGGLGTAFRNLRAALDTEPVGKCPDTQCIYFRHPDPDSRSRMYLCAEHWPMHQDSLEKRRRSQLGLPDAEPVGEAIRVIEYEDIRGAIRVAVAAEQSPSARRAIEDIAAKAHAAGRAEMEPAIRLLQQLIEAESVDLTYFPEVAALLAKLPTPEAEPGATELSGGMSLLCDGGENGRCGLALDHDGDHVSEAE